jgi:hypothetical protein
MVNNLSAPNPRLLNNGSTRRFIPPQIDGMFITAQNGDLIASIPTASEMIKGFSSNTGVSTVQWQPLSGLSRASDNRRY